MLYESDPHFSQDTEILHRGAYVRKPVEYPEAMPIYLTTAFNVEDLDEVEARYNADGFCYNRISNPNRTALCQLMTYLEHGEDSIACSSGMAAIANAALTVVRSGDHILSDRTLYGETVELFNVLLGSCGVETTYVDFTDTDLVARSIRTNTKLLYTETVSNPMITVPDLRALADIAHGAGALLAVDNTFMTAALCRPLDLGADLVVNSLTKFANGHSDAVCGSLTGPADLIHRALERQVLLGSQADPFSSWLVQRGIRTMDLRVPRQSDNACALAAALDRCPHVLRVYHPSLECHPQHALAQAQFEGFGGMLSIVLPDDRQRMNTFLRALHLAHYAMTLGGYRTTLAYPVLSSHAEMPEPERLKLGITNGLLRISCGIEKAEDLTADFLSALDAAYGG